MLAPEKCTGDYFLIIVLFSLIKKDGNYVLKDISLSLRRGEHIAMVGMNGSGKTTLIRAILGILPPGGTVTEGKILFQGKNILELDETSLQKLRGTEIAMIFQDVGASLDPIRIVESQYRESILAHRKMAKADCRSLEKKCWQKCI